MVALAFCFQTRHRSFVFQVRVIVTEHATHFVDVTTLGGVQVLRDADEWSTFAKIGDPVLHIELRKWADAMLVAPLSANTLAKISNGQCDNLLVRLFFLCLSCVCFRVDPVFASSDKDMRHSCMGLSTIANDLSSRHDLLARVMFDQRTSKTN